MNLLYRLAAICRSPFRGRRRVDLVIEDECSKILQKADEEERGLVIGELGQIQHNCSLYRNVASPAPAVRGIYAVLQ